MTVLNNREPGTRNEKARMDAVEVTELAVLCVLMFVGKELLRMIPNVHPVTVLIMYAVIMYGWRTLYPVFGFIFLETLVYGFGIWVPMYLYTWPILVAISMPLRHSRNWIVWAGVACLFGLSFGALCYAPYIFISGFKPALSMWIAGIPFDIIHGVSNFVTVLVVLPLLCKVSARRSVNA